MEPHCLAGRAMEPGHLLHSALTRPSSANARRLKSRHPFVPAAQHLISSSDDNNIRAAQWADYQWNAEWADSEFPKRRQAQSYICFTRPDWPVQSRDKGR